MVEGYSRRRNEFVSKVRPTIDETKSTGVTTFMGIAACRNRRGIPTRSGDPALQCPTERCIELRAKIAPTAS
jgi:hypothetical protein